MGAVEIDRDENIEIAAETQSKNHTSDNLVKVQSTTAQKNERLDAKQKALQDRIQALEASLKQVTEERDAFVESQKEKEKESVEEVNTEEMSVKQKKLNTKVRSIATSLSRSYKAWKRLEEKKTRNRDNEGRH